VAPPDAGEEAVAEVTERLDADIARISAGGELSVDAKLIRHKSVNVGVLKEAKNYDAVVIGATGHATYQQILFGSIPETIAKRSDGPVILVKHHHPVKALLRRVMADGP
jgi:nucleotide-binding universal stress UspA family protein